METFIELGIKQDIIDILKTRYIINPTKIQTLVIPGLLKGKSVLFRSATGTGKTFAYLLPILGKLISHSGTAAQRGIKVLICAPTLELCSQIENEINFLLNSKKPSPRSSIFNSIIVGTPGRLYSLAKTGNLKIKDLRFLVLDEADRLTAQDCLEDTKGLLSFIEKTSPNLCAAGCSATVTKKTAEKLGKLFKNVEFIECDDHEVLCEKIEHWAIYSEKRKRTQTLRSFIAAILGQTGKSKKSKIKILVFTSKNDDAALIHSQLMHHKIAAEGLYGKINKNPLSAEQRRQALDSFLSGKAQVLVATDLAARGLDIPAITHVAALDVPDDSGIYVHRAGRTGRAGKRGIMVTIGDETQMRLLVSLEKKLKIKIIPKVLYGGRVLPVDFLES